MIAGSKVFIPDKEQVWLRAEIVSVGSKVAKVKVEEQMGDYELDNPPISQRVIDVSPRTGSMDTLTILPFQNEGVGECGVDDMAELDHLHEASILYNIRARFFRGIPYTATGDIIIAVNPYQWFPIYDKDTQDMYAPEQYESEAPHIYSTSAAAFKDMRTSTRSQSILVSGDSGSGKTETAKLLIEHLARSSRRWGRLHAPRPVAWRCSEAETRAEEVAKAQAAVIRRLVECNPLLESFGNATTVRNDNSSRFGKLSALQFTEGGGALLGARCATYLLEKSRVIFQEEGEFNYHIFYQILAMDTHKANEMFLEPETPYAFVRQPGGEGGGGRFSASLPASVWRRRVHSGDDLMSDEEEEMGGNNDIAAALGEERAEVRAWWHRRMQRTSAALKLIGVDSHTQDSVFAVLAAICHLGEVEEEEVEASAGGVGGGGGGGGGEDHCRCVTRLSRVEWEEDEARERDADGRGEWPDALGRAALLLECEREELEEALCYRSVVVGAEIWRKPLTRPQVWATRSGLAKSLYATCSIGWWSK